MKKRIDKAKNTIKDFFDNFFRVLRRPDMVLLPGNLSFFFVLAIIPTLGLISYGASILNLSTDVLYDFIAGSFSAEMADIILGVNLGNNVGIQFVITLIVGLYVASNSADAIIVASNTIYHIENKSWFKRRFKAMGISFLIVVLLIFMLIIPVFGNIIIDLIKEVDIGDLITTRIIAVINLLKGPISWLIIFAFIRIIYAVAPDSKPKNRVINYGAFFTTVGWIVGTKIYSAYVTGYADYSALYGSLAGIVVLMIWIYFLSYIFTVGIALNSQQDENNLLKTGTIKVEK
ncbi:MAG: YihY/virulence factor BrkB family protein [Firmicutes bacterium]|nr:YihY/virulence factor BrkB family protein [Bacillota bacterium]